jgi:hypothetical protein
MSGLLPSAQMSGSSMDFEFCEGGVCIRDSIMSYWQFSMIGPLLANKNLGPGWGGAQRV